MYHAQGQRQQTPRRRILYALSHFKHIYYLNALVERMWRVFQIHAICQHTHTHIPCAHKLTQHEEIKANVVLAQYNCTLYSMPRATYGLRAQCMTYSKYYDSLAVAGHGIRVNGNFS